MHELRSDQLESLIETRFRQPEPLVLLADSDPGRLQELARLISASAWRISAAFSWEETRSRIRLISPDLVVLDESLARSFAAEGGFAVPQGAQEPGPVILVSLEKRDSAVMEELISLGAADFIVRPWLAPELLARVNNLVESRWARGIQSRLLEELQIANELINILSVTDSLTGFYNYRGFMPLATQQAKLARRQGRPMMLAYMDIDGMREVNDRFGYLAGDQLLADCSTVIRRSFRDSDIIARMGGDEFAVLLVDSSDIKTRQLVNRLQGHIDQFNADESREYSISMSIGIVPFEPGGPETLEEMLSQADALMKKDRANKKKARN